MYSLRYNAMQSVEIQLMFQRNTAKRYLLLASTLQIEATCSSETSVGFQRTKRRQILFYIKLCSFSQFVSCVCHSSYRLVFHSFSHHTSEALHVALRIISFPIG
jgi:hypothetical protein